MIGIVIVGLLMQSCEQKPKELVFYDGSLGQMENEAQEEGKPYYVYFTADWCQPCQIMKKNVFTLPEVYELSNAKYLAIMIDVDEFNGQELSKQYDVQGIPTIIFFNSEGEAQTRLTGLLSSDQFMAALNEFK